MTPKAACDPREMFRTADHFFLAAERCGTLDNHLGIVASPGTLLFPYLVNYALAAEIALKALHGIAFGVQWKPPKGGTGHDLKALFDALPAYMQAPIIGTSWSRQQIDRLLDTIKDTFLIWRYPYERGENRTMSPLGMRKFAESALAELQKQCRKLPTTAGAPRVPTLPSPFVELAEPLKVMPRRVPSRRARSIFALSKRCTPADGRARR